MDKEIEKVKQEYEEKQRQKKAKKKAKDDDKDKKKDEDDDNDKAEKERDEKVRYPESLPGLRICPLGDPKVRASLDQSHPDRRKRRRKDGRHPSRVCATEVSPNANLASQAWSMLMSRNLQEHFIRCG